MNIDAIRVLLALLDTGTVQGASDVLGYSRATVRRRLQELEESTGVALLHRGLDGIRPTSAGRLVAERGRRMVEEMSVLLEEVRSTSPEPPSVLRLLMAEGLATHYCAELLTETLTAIPGLRLQVRQSPDPLAELIEDTDVAFVFNEGERDGPWGKIPLVPTPERLVARPDILEAHPVREVADLAHHNLLVWRSPEYPTDMLPLWSGESVPITPRVISADLELLHGMALEGAGIALVPDGEIDYQHHPRDAVVRVLPDLVGRERWFSAIAADSLRELPRVQELMKALQQFASRVRGEQRLSR